MEQPTEIQAEILKVLEPAQKEMRGLVEKAQDIQRELLSKQERDSNPADVTVRDLEAKLDEHRAEVAAMREEQRLQVAQITQAQGDRNSNPFDGAFVRDLEKIRTAARQYGSLSNAMKQRAIDTSVIASAGSLSADQENQFLDWLIEKQVTLSRVRIYPMVSGSAYLDELITASRKLRAGVENTEPSLSDAFTTARRQLDVVETIWAEDITLDFVENNIERGNINNHIARNLAVAFGNDHNDLLWNGDDSLAATITDTTPADGVDDTTGLSQNDHTFLRINDGLIAIATSDANVNDTDATSLTTAQAVFKEMLKDMPFDYKARMDLDLSYLVPYNLAHTYADELTERGTDFADRVLINGLPELRYFGLPVIAESHLGRTHTSPDNAVLTPRQNIFWGLQRGMTMESEWRPRKRAWEFTLTAKADVNYAKSQAVVLADNIPSSLL